MHQQSGNRGGGIQYAFNRAQLVGCNIGCLQLFGNHTKHLPATEWNDHAAADSGSGIAQVVKLTSVPYRNRYSNDSAQFLSRRLH